MAFRPYSFNLPYFASPALVREMESSFALGHDSEHGPRHWKRVFVIGQYLAKLSGADKELIGLFALLHDSQRITEDADPEHGIRAAEYIRKLAKHELSYIRPDSLDTLLFACERHSDKLASSADVTVRTCWDSDRLDLLRLGIMPDPALLHTDAAKTAEALDFANSLGEEY